MHPLDVAVHHVGPRGRTLGLFARVGAGGAGVVIIGITAVSVAVVPILEALDGRRGWLQCARGGIVATAGLP